MNTTCRDMVAQLPAFVDGELASETDQIVRAHLRVCAGCCQVRDALALVSRGLDADAEWQPQTNGLVSAVIGRLDAGACAQTSSVSRIVRFALPLAAAAAVLVLTGVVWVRQTSRPAAAVPVVMTVAPPMVVDRPVMAVAAPLPAAAAPTEEAEPPGMVVRRATPEPVRVMELAPSPVNTDLPAAKLQPFQLGAMAAPAGRAFVIRNGQPQAYEGPTFVKIDRMPNGPVALRVDAFPREQPAGRGKPASRRL